MRCPYSGRYHGYVCEAAAVTCIDCGGAFCRSHVAYSAPDCDDPRCPKCTAIQLRGTRHMFQEQLAAYLTGFSTKRDQKAEDKPLLVVLSFTVQPFTEDLCKQIAPEFARRFFNTGGVRVPNLGGLWFSVKEPQQRVTWQTAPGDMPKAITMRNADVGPKWRIRADKETDGYGASFDITFGYPTGQDLQTIANAVNTSVWLEFDVEQEGLLNDKVDETPRVKKGRKAQAETTESTH